MTTDDDRISYLSGNDAAGAVDDDERRDLDEVRAILADPSIWAEPSADLEGAVVAAVSAEAASRRTPLATSSHAARRGRGLRIAALAATAAAAIAVAVVIGPGADDGDPDLDATLRATELVPEAEGYATFTRTDSGWRIELDATGLPRLDDGAFYQAWLRNDADTFVAIGTFNEPDHVVLWAGVSPLEFTTITITEESADADPSSSGRRVLVGTVAGGR